MISIDLLRPVAWLEANDADPGHLVWLSVPEMGVNDWMTVFAVDPCPAEAAGPIAGLVTGTFETERAAIVSLYIESLDEPIGVTAAHPLYSLDRNDWIAAGRLVPAEQVLTADGSVTIGWTTPRPVPQAVYNLEVQGTHTYCVSIDGIWVHNSCVVGGGATLNGSS